MKKINFAKLLQASTLLMSGALLSACGSDDSTAGDTDVCTSTGTEVNWEALLTENCENLSDYNLFSDATDPSSNPNSAGIPYDLSTPLFTDYASKYRFVFVPEGETATYSEYEVMEFPVGTVLVKTFSLPDDTSNREGDETKIETRLLINRADGWTSLPCLLYTHDAAADSHCVASLGALSLKKISRLLLIVS